MRWRIDRFVRSVFSKMRILRPFEFRVSKCPALWWKPCDSLRDQWRVAYWIDEWKMQKLYIDTLTLTYMNYYDDTY